MKSLLFLFSLACFSATAQIPAIPKAVKIDTVDGRIRYSRVMNVYRRSDAAIFAFAMDFSQHHQGSYFYINNDLIGDKYFDSPNANMPQIQVRRDSLGYRASDSEVHSVLGRIIWCFNDKCGITYRITGSSIIECKEYRTKISISDLYCEIIDNTKKERPCKENANIEEMYKCEPCAGASARILSFSEEAATKCFEYYKKYLVAKVKTDDNW